MEVSDVRAMFELGCCYCEGYRNQTKALELYHRAGELGCMKAYFNIGCEYDNVAGVERDEVKANHYYELAAMGGFATARHNLGNAEFLTGN